VGRPVVAVVSVLSVTVGLSIGLTYGSISGYAGGWVDFWMMRVVDIILSLPGLLLTITIVLFLGPGLNTIAFAIAIENVPIFARLVRSSILALKESDFVLAAHSIGRRTGASCLRTSCPTPYAGHRPGDAGACNCDRRRGRPGLPGLRTAGSGHSRVGDDAYRYAALPDEWGRLHGALPGIAIILAVLGFNLLGDGLREALDPRLKR